MASEPTFTPIPGFAFPPGDVLAQIAARHPENVIMDITLQWVVCANCLASQSPHERWPICAYCGHDHAPSPTPETETP